MKKTPIVGKALLAAALLLAGWLCRAETMLFKRELAVCEPIEVHLSPEQLSAAELAAGEITLYITADNRTAGWTLYATPEAMFLSDGETAVPLANPPGAAHYGGIPSGRPLKLVFPLPPRAATAGVTLHNTMGIYSMLAQPDGPYTVEVWKGLRPAVKSYVDRMNRNYIIDASAAGDEALRFHYRTPDGRTVTTRSSSWRGRLGDSLEPFSVGVGIDTVGGERVETEVTVTPHPAPTPPPLPAEDIQVGICYYRVYDRDKDEWSWGIEPSQRETANVRDFIDRELGNLFVLWGEEPEFVEEKFNLLEEMADRGIGLLTIYHSDPAELLERYRETMRGRFLENNIGEYAGHLYQGPESAAMFNLPTDMTDMREARDYFINQFINGRVRGEHANYRWFFSTSGSALAAYELAGGVDFMCSELYAVGANNVAYATAEMRGAARRWQPEYWGGWLAEEWQTQGLPYEVPQKYDLLKVGLYLEYLMGTSVIVLESGADFTQAAQYTVTPADSEFGGRPSNRNQGYDGYAPANYRRTMKEFYDFVRNHPRPAGSPDTRIAVLLGNCDSWVGAYHDWIPAWAQHETAKNDPNWLYGDPERSWQAAMQVFFPILPDALAPYGNYFVGGSPQGQVDVVGIDEELRPDDLDRYRLAVFAGWNSMTPEVADALAGYVENGGRLLLSVPHLSTRFDRNYRSYAAADLIDGGDLSRLIDLTVTGREPVAAPLSGAWAGGEAARLDGATLAAAEPGAGVEVLIAADGRPVLVSQPRGRGRVYLLLTWEYPGNAAVAPLYRDVLRRLAGEVEQPVSIEPAGGSDDTDAIAFAAWPGKAYFLNTDCVSPRTVAAVVDGRRETLTLQPTEFRIIER